MAMQVGGEGGDEAPISAINTTPLVDVMLVLLIIFLITVPVVLQTVPVSLPKTAFQPTTTKPENVNLSIRAVGGACEVYWGQRRVSAQELLDQGVEALRREVERQGGPGAITADSLPEVHIRGDINTPYRCIGGAVFQMQRAGFTRVGFISEPQPGQAQ